MAIHEVASLELERLLPRASLELERLLPSACHDVGVVVHAQYVYLVQ